MTRTLPLSALCLSLLSLPAQADDEAPALSVAVSPLPSAGPYKMRMTLTAHRAAEVATDRRLLRFTVRPKVEGRRRAPRLRCHHPAAPRRATRTEPMAAGQSYEEWFDLRMYCWGRALRALEGGEATVELEYGFPRRGRDRFVARAEGERRPPHRVEGGSIDWRPPPATRVPGAEEPPVEVGLVATSSRGAPRLRPTLRATSGRPRAYLRDDLWSFVVRGPLGTVECRPSRQVISPIVDFYRRLRTRPTRATLDVAYYCPEDTFSVPGVYEVTPRIDLIYHADGFDFDAVTGSFEGEPEPVRVTRGEYVEQTMDTLPTSGW